jgi:predicted nucleic acid-binding protein
MGRRSEASEMAQKHAFVDTTCWVAILSKSDQLHRSAKNVYEKLFKDGFIFTTTSAVINETANSLAEPRYRRNVAEFYKRLIASPRIEIVFVDEVLWSKGWELYEKYTDKKWSLTDCISMTVMKERSLVETLTHDEHFRQAGFKILL